MAGPVLRHAHGRVRRRGDQDRDARPGRRPAAPRAHRGRLPYWFAVDNRNKSVMTLDLHTAAGQDIVRRLVPQVDVVLENFRPGVLEGWGLGWEELSRINPRLVMARITAFGQTGPLRQGPGFAAIGSAFGGTWYLNGPADRPPARPTPVYPDYLTGLFTAFGVMVALRHRDATGRGPVDRRRALRVGVPHHGVHGDRGTAARASVRERGGVAARGLAGRRVPDQGRPLGRLHRAGPASLRAPVRDARASPSCPRTRASPPPRSAPRTWPCILEHAHGVVRRARPFDEAIGSLEGARGAALADHEHGRHLRRPALPRAQHDPRRAGRSLGTLPQPGVVPKLSLTPGRVDHAGAADRPAHRRDPRGLLGDVARRDRRSVRDGVI